MKHSTIPLELIARDQWVCYKLEYRPGTTKATKPPYQPSGERADVSNLSTWSSFDEVLDRFDGFGFVFTADDPFIGIDLDHCREPTTGILTDEAQWVLTHCPTYTEISPSGTGLHLIGRGTWPFEEHRHDNIEIYDDKRYFTMTDMRLDTTPATINDISPDTLQELHQRAFPPKTTQTSSASPPPLSTPSPVDLLAQMLVSQSGAQIQRLWDGDTSGYPSPSEADLALCSHLAWWTQKDADKVDRLFRLSGLMRAKWNRGDYRASTIARALNQAGQYNPATLHVGPSPNRSVAENPEGAQGGRPQEGEGSTPPSQHPAPTIVIDADIIRMVDEGIAALETLPEESRLYQRAGILTMLTTGAKPPRGIRRPDDATTIAPVQGARIRELATASAQWCKYDARRKKYVAAMPPGLFADTVLARPNWPFPPLEGLISAPTMRPDGSILDQPGYDAETGLYFVPNGIIYPAMPTAPTWGDAQAALRTLYEVTCDFPFATAGHRSAAWTALLTLCARHAIEGNVPLFAIRATTSATGKGLLADTLSLIALGRLASKWAQCDEDEERKSLLAIALAGEQIVLIDNITRPLGSGPLDSALTAGVIEGRILGRTETQRASLTAVFLATGNNLQFKGDMVRRVVPIDLDAGTEKPEERTGFAHNPLLPWIRQERPRIAVAALTLLAAYTHAGRPSQELTPYGSFEEWSDLIRSALVWAGEVDPCEGRKTLAAESDSAYSALAALLDAWITCYPHAVTGKVPQRSIRQVLDDIENARPGHNAPLPASWQNLLDALSEFDRTRGDTLNRRSVAASLRAIEGRVIGGHRLRRETGGAQPRWFCERI